MTYTSKTDTFSIGGKFIRETEKALFIRVVEVEGEELPSPREEWFPKTQITDQRLSDDPEKLDKFDAKRWIMEGKNLI